MILQLGLNHVQLVIQYNTYKSMIHSLLYYQIIIYHSILMQDSRFTYNIETIESIKSPSREKCPKLQFIYEQQLQQPRNIKQKNIQKLSETNCRICLEPCPPIQFCQCKKDLLSHENCLIRYLEKKISCKNSTISCEICRYHYILNYQTQCRFSISKVKQVVRQNPYKCLVYTLFYLITAFFYGFFSYLLTRQTIQSNIETILFLVAGFITFLFIFFLGAWLSQYAIVRNKKIKHIIPKQIYKRKRKHIGFKRQIQHDTSLQQIG